MGWLNADDLYFKGSLFHLANIFSNYKQINWLTGSNTHIDEDGNILLNIPCRRFNKYQYLNGDYMWIAQESTLWHRDLWDMAGAFINTDLRAAGDFDLWLRFIQNAPLYYVNNCIGMFRHRKGQLSGNIDDYTKEVKQIYKTLKVSDEDKKIITRYRRKKNLANLINKTRVFNGNKILRLKTFEKNYMPIMPTLVWYDDIQGYRFSSE